MRVTYPGGLPGLGRQLALLLQLRKKDGAEAEDCADAEAAQPADDERGEVLQRASEPRALECSSENCANQTIGEETKKSI